MSSYDVVLGLKLASDDSWMLNYWSRVLGFFELHRCVVSVEPFLILFMFILFRFCLSRIWLIILSLFWWLLLAWVQREICAFPVATMSTGLWCGCWGIVLDAAGLPELGGVRLGCVMQTLRLLALISGSEPFFLELNLVIGIMGDAFHTFWQIMRDVLVAWPTSWGMRLLGAAKHTRDVYGCMCGC